MIKALKIAINKEYINIKKCITEVKKAL